MQINSFVNSDRISFCKDKSTFVTLSEVEVQSAKGKSTFTTRCFDFPTRGFAQHDKSDTTT